MSLVLEKEERKPVSVVLLVSLFESLSFCFKLLLRGQELKEPLGWTLCYVLFDICEICPTEVCVLQLLFVLLLFDGMGNVWFSLFHSRDL